MTDVKKIRSLFEFLRETYVLDSSHSSVGEVRYYIDNASLERELEDGTVQEPGAVESAYFDFAVRGIAIHHNGQELVLKIEHKLDTEFSDFDMGAFITSVKKNFKAFGVLKKKKVVKVKKKVVKKVTKPVSKFVVIEGKRYKLVPTRK